MTALEEQRGGALDVTLNLGDSPYIAQLDSGPNRARLYVVRPNDSGIEFSLPFATDCTIGCKPSVTVANLGSFAIDVLERTTPVQTVGVGQACEFYALPDGTWLPVVSSITCAESAALNAVRIPYVVAYTASSSTVTNLRRDISRQYGYTSSMGPVAIVCRIGAGVVLGGGNTEQGSFDSGAWPTGSTLLLQMEAGSMIVGRGGLGGSGMQVNGTGQTAGGAGGHGLDVYLPTVIVAAGATIAGGGGGGGGGARRRDNGIDYFGGSGGGGAGAPVGAGGPVMQGDLSSAGQPGGLMAGGLGGQPNAFAAAGGAGGGLGVVGNAGQNSNLTGIFGAAGGAAGNSTRRLPAATLTVIGSLTLLGSQVTL